jgi:uncharacterized membrane protein
MLTSDGATATAQWIADRLDGAELVVTDGQTSASAGALVSADQGVVTLSASFGEHEANFEWRRRAVVHRDLELDVDDVDLGRKVAGAVWLLEVPISVVS